MGSYKNIEDYLITLPKNIPLSVQIHRKYNKEELEEKKFVIQKAIEIINPSIILVYGNDSKIELFKDVFKNTKIKLLYTHFSKN